MQILLQLDAQPTFPFVVVLAGAPCLTDGCKCGEGRGNVLDGSGTTDSPVVIGRWRIAD
jgi:hypothetical protein